jgi:hypothetical protein
MIDDTETSAMKALVETGEQLFNRALQGESVEAELKAWSKRVGAMTSSGSKILGSLHNLHHWSIRERARVRSILRGAR